MLSFLFSRFTSPVFWGDVVLFVICSALVALLVRVIRKYRTQITSRQKARGINSFLAVAIIAPAWFLPVATSNGRQGVCYVLMGVIIAATIALLVRYEKKPQVIELATAEPESTEESAE